MRCDIGAPTPSAWLLVKRAVWLCARLEQVDQLDARLRERVQGPGLPQILRGVQNVSPPCHPLRAIPLEIVVPYVLCSI